MCRWIVDADRLQMHDFDEEVLYRNKIVDSFINNDRNLGIEAPKGMGKTFLLKCKRMKSQEQGIRCLPQDSMCDILDKVTFEESMSTYLKDYVVWIDMWKLSICISLIKSDIFPEEHKDEILSKIAAEENELFNEIYQSSFIITPCQIMNYLINGKRALIRNLQLIIPFSIAAIKMIHQPIHMFIDKTDQALRDNLHFINGASQATRGPNNNSYWAYAQIALAEAAYTIFTQNSHIKVFFSIRSEAFVGAESFTNLFLQIRNYIVKLEYSYSELHDMFKHYVSIENDDCLVLSKYKSKNASKAFVGVEYIPHGYVKNSNNEYIEEPFFEYIFRHTLKRPRDIMHICYSLCYSQIASKPSEEEKYKEIRHIVNKESRLILQAYLREMGPFVFDKYADKWEQFWTCVSRNIFTNNYAKYICNIINDSNEMICDKKCIQCDKFKPFSSLYNTGLLGVIESNNVDLDPHYINFQDTGNAIINTDDNLLPVSPLYFLHPMLTNKIEKVRKEIGQRFDVCKELIVGDKRVISEQNISHINTCEIEMLNTINTNGIFISSTCHDLTDYRMMLFKQLTRNGYKVIMSDAKDFITPDSGTNSYDHCLNNVLKCNTLIFIIGSRYGGTYRGENYRNLALEIGNNNPLLKDPSISLMEFYLAHKNEIKTYVFVKKEIYNERNTYMKNRGNSSFIPAFVNDIRVFETISYITNLPKGNWLRQYEDLQDLEEIIKIEFGSN